MNVQTKLYMRQHRDGYKMHHFSFMSMPEMRGDSALEFELAEIFAACPQTVLKVLKKENQAEEQAQLHSELTRLQKKIL